jgi:Zn-dependent protease with chaperone function
MNTTISIPRPQAVPKDLTKLSNAYLLKATLAVGAILLFFILYISLIVGLAFLVKWAFWYEIENINKFTILAKIGAIAGSIMLFVFTLKFIFKLKNHQPANRIKLDKKEFPELFEFVYQICRETGAPKPKSIYIDPDVNAYVSYTNVWLSLFFPTGKDLTIGLGLVSILNLSEFKAVTAHEFGHFAQKSMKIGSYIHSANTIIHDMIFNRDKWDEVLDKWRGSDIRLSAAAWAITPVIWLIRKLLEGFYMFLNFMHSALSREMEFNADKVAVKTSGSVAIVSALWKLDFGSTYWDTIVNNAYHATKKNFFTENLYQHNLKFIENDKPNLLAKLNELPQESTGARQFFSGSNASTVSMYASHPPNDHREKNAKTPFVQCQSDERSAWLLFANAQQVQKKMTLLVYENYLGKKPETFAGLAEFEKFIAAESRNAQLTAEFENTFQNRFITIPDVATFKALEAYEGDCTFRREKLKSELQALMQPVVALEEKMTKVHQIAAGETKEKAYEYEGKNYLKKNLQECYDLLFERREQLFKESFKQWDADFLQFNYRLAKAKNSEAHLLDLYVQHQKIIEIYQGLIATKNNIVNEINRLQTKGTDITQAMVSALAEEIVAMVDAFNAKMAALDTIQFVPLSNIDTLAELKDAIVDGGTITREPGPIFEDGGIDRILTALDNGVLNCNRVENKVIDSVLLFQKELMAS